MDAKAEDFEWAKDRVFAKLSTTLREKHQSLESLFKSTLQKDSTKINKRDFLTCLTQLNSSVSIDDLDSMLDKLADSYNKVDLTFFYYLYKLFTGEIANIDTLYEKVIGILADDLKNKIEDYLNCSDKSVDGTIVKTIEENKLVDYLKANSIKAASDKRMTPDEITDFTSLFRILSMPGLVNISKLDSELTKLHKKPERASTEVKTYSDMMEMLRVACVRWFTDPYELYKNIDIAETGLIGRSEFEEGLSEIGLMMDTTDVDAFFMQLDEDRDSKVSYLRLSEQLEKCSEKSGKQIKPGEPLYEIFAQIRKYLRDRNGMPLYKIFRKGIVKKKGDELFLEYSELRNALTAMKVTFDNSVYEALEKYLDTSNKGRIDYLFFNEKLGYVHRVLALRPKTTTKKTMGVSQSQFIDPSRIAEDFMRRLSVYVVEHKINLKQRFYEYDVHYTGKITQVEFRRFMEKLIKDEFSSAQINKVAEGFLDPTDNGKVNYIKFITDLNNFYNKMIVLTDIYLELYRYMTEKKSDNLMPLLEGRSAKGLKTLTKGEFRELLNQECMIPISDENFDLVVKEFDVANNNMVDLYELCSKFNEFVKRKKEEGIIKEPERHAVSALLETIKNYCDRRNIGPMDIFKNENIEDDTMTQFDFQKVLSDPNGLNFTDEDAIYLLNAEITIQGRVDLKLLLRMYNKEFKESEENIGVILARKDVEDMIDRIVKHAAIHNKSIEDAVKAQDPERTGYISNKAIEEVWRSGFGLQMEKKGLFDKFNRTYDQENRGRMDYSSLLEKMNKKLHDRIDCRKYLSKLKSYMIVNKIYIHDKFLLEDYLHERFLPRETIEKIIKDIGFNEDKELFEKVINVMPKNVKKEIDYIVLENEIKEAPDISYDEQVLTTPEQLADPEIVLDRLARKVSTKFINLDEIMADHDYYNKGELDYNRFIDILMAMQLNEFNKYDMGKLADKYVSESYTKVNYKSFLVDLKEKSKQYEILNEKTGLHWAEHILEKISIKLYIDGKDCVKYYLDLALMNEGSRTTTKENFEEGMRRLDSEADQSELSRMAKELSVNQASEVNILELSNLVLIKTPQACNKYEHNLFCDIYNYMVKEDLNLMSILKHHDKEGTSSITLDVFVTSLRNVLDQVLRDDRMRYLKRKYVNENDLINYPTFVDDVNRIGSQIELQKDGEQRTGIDIITVLDKFREAVRGFQISLHSYFETQDKPGKGRLPMVLIQQFMDKAQLNKDETNALKSIIGYESNNTFEYRILLQLLWMEDEDPKEKEAGAMELCRKINVYCEKKNVDLDGYFIRLAKDKSGFMSTEHVKQAFDSSGMRLSHTQLNSLLYYLGLQTDLSGRKNYIELLGKIFGEQSNAAKKLSELPEIMPKRPLIVENKEEQEVKAESKKAEELPSIPQINVLEEVKSYKPVPYTGYRSIFQQGLLKFIAKYVFSSRINLMDHFKAQDLANSGYINSETFFQILNELNIELNDNDKKEILALPEILQGTSNVRYIVFINYLIEKDYDMKAEESFMKTNQSFRNSQYPIKKTAMSFLVNDIHEIILSENELQHADELIKALRQHMDEHGYSYEATFEAKDTQHSGYLPLDTFWKTLSDVGYKFVEKSHINTLYAYLRASMDKEISLARLKDCLVDGILLKQYRSKADQDYLKNLKANLQTTQLAIDKLRQYLRANKIAPSRFKEFATTPGGRIITQIEFYRALKEFGYNELASEMHQIFLSILIDSENNDDNGSLLKLIELLTKTREQASKVSELDEKYQQILNKITEKLLEEGTSMFSFISSLDVNKDGYTTYSEFVDVISKLNIAVGKKELFELAAIIDGNDNKFLSANEVMMYLVTERKLRNESRIEISVDDMIINEVESLFKSLDENNDGKISEEELYRGLLASRNGKVTMAEVKEVMKALDSNNNGYLDHNEFKTFMLEQIKRSILEAEDCMEDLRVKFREADIDGNGWLSTDEIYELIKREYPNIKLDELTNFIAECDVDKNMKIDIDEFIDFLSRPYQKAMEMKKTPGQNGLIAIKASRRISPSDFMAMFDRVANGGLYLESFIAERLKQMRNLPSQEFQLNLNMMSLKYDDLMISSETQGILPMNLIIAGTLSLINAVGVPIPSSASFNRSQILNRLTRMCFYDEDREEFVHNSTFAEVEWDDQDEGTWRFNKEREIGTNPIIFKWTRGSTSNIKLIIELTIEVKKKGKIFEASNGWTEIPLDKLAVGKEYTLSLKGGTLKRPGDLNPISKENVINRSSANIVKALTTGHKSQITIAIKSFSELSQTKKVRLD